ncbi:hypothetical protein BGX38DRAFT_1280114 [Terfezia claveryi]|nr:hypothetical protein BGX38DRAFT_1280114 [Terfezia claveryi]
MVLGLGRTLSMNSGSGSTQSPNPRKTAIEVPSEVKSESAGDLSPVLLLSVRARVMVTKKL